MYTTLRVLLVAILLVVVGVPAATAADASSIEVVQIWACQMVGSTTETQVEAVAHDWLVAIRQLPGGAAVKMRVFFPAVSSDNSDTDFYFVMTAPSFTDWGKIWDAYTDDTAAAKSEDLNAGKVNCPDSMLWEAHDVAAN